MAAAYGQAGHASVIGGSRLEQRFLPNGACGFRDLAAGVQAPTCGCRRFWLNNTIGPGRQEFCWCGHHACFHEIVQPAQGQPQGQLGSAFNAFPSSHQANSQSQPGAWIPPTWSELIGEHDEPGPSNNTANHMAAAPGSATGLGIRNSHSPSQPRSINTRLWHTLNGFARNQDGDRHSDRSSYLPSTAVPSLYDEPQNRNMGPPVFIPATNINDNRMEEYSATEVATPSVHDTPDFRTLAPPSRRDVSSPAHRPERPSRSNPATGGVVRHAHASRTSQPTPPPTVSVGPALSIQEMCNTIQNYGERINFLEGVSFGHMPSAEAQERFDLIDGRLIDLETWRKDEDKANLSDDTHARLDEFDSRLQDVEDWRVDQENAQSSQDSEAIAKSSTAARRRNLAIETSSFASDGSFDESAAVQTETVLLAALAADAETGPRIDALESRIVDLESAALPTFARPWHVQLVLLPFGRELPGVWFSSAESSRQSISSATQASEEWAGLGASTKTSFRSADSNGVWTTESIEAWTHETQEEWLSPKACGPSGTVFQRLASRGLVQNIVLQSSDARHICSSIASAFDGTLHNDEDSKSATDITFLGLKERFIPLRKVRKSSRLRFLSRAEMLTPAVWSAAFLESSVFMKVGDGERRLYLTTPEGYTQPPRPCWTWPSLRALAMYDVAGEVQQAQAAGNVVEGCWTRHSHLDQSTSLPSSFKSSQDSPWAGSNANEEGSEQSDQQQDTALLSPTATRRSYVRSASLPSSNPAFARSMVDIETLPKRRVASFELEGPATSSEHPPGYVAKRRRISTSPELERRGVNFTPRWSREPPSPYTEDIGFGRSSQAPSSRARGTTPFAYATPHSHLDSRNGDDDGDTEVDDAADMDFFQTDDADNGEEWEGVQEQDRSNSERSFHSDDEGADEEDYVEEDSLDDGLTIYEA